MGQEVGGVPEAPALSAAADDDGSIGRYLAGQRRLRGISLDDLSARTKIPIRSLERLESGAFDRDPDGFARGFVRTVATALGLDVDETLMRLRAEPDDPDDTDESRWPPEARRALLAGGALAAVGLLLGLAVWALRSVPAGPPEEPADTAVLYRRDAVRDLAQDVTPADEPESP